MELRSRSRGNTPSRSVEGTPAASPALENGIDSAVRRSGRERRTAAIYDPSNEAIQPPFKKAKVIREKETEQEEDDTMLAPPDIRHRNPCLYS